MKTVLITGGAGFIGSHLAEALIAQDHKVIVVDNESTGRRQNLSAIESHPNFEFVTGCADDATLLKPMLEDVDLVYHLAAAVGVQLLAENPVHAIKTNIHPTMVLLDLLHQQHLQGKSVKFFFASSSEVYGKNPDQQWNERQELVLGPTTGMRWSYGTSKALDEFLTLAYFQQHAMPVVISRFFNVVGPRQIGTYGMVLPRFVQAALSNQPLTIHNDGKQVRCFAHVKDVVKAVIQLMNAPDAVGKVVNVGSDQPISIYDLAKRVKELCQSSSMIQFQSFQDVYGSGFEDVQYRVPDLTLARQLIHYAPQYDLDATIREMIESYSAISKK